MDATSEARWAKVGKVLSVVVTLVGAVVGIIVGIGKINAPGPDVVVEVGAGPFRPLPTADLRLRELLRLSSQESLTGALEGLLQDSADTGLVARRLEGHFRIFSSEPYLRGFLAGTIVNQGDRPADDVVVTINRGRVARLQRDDGSDTILEINDVLPVGRLRTRESVEIEVWLDSPYSVWEASGQVAVTHAEGVGVVALGVPVAGVPLFLKKYWSILILLVLALSAYLVLYLGVQWTNRRARADSPAAARDSS
jgi:hypothetical protein